MRLLVVEDDPKIGRLLVRGLAEEGFRIDHAVDATEAELYVDDREYDCILLDRRLPDTSGDALLTRWRRSGVGTPVLMLTALDRVEDRVVGLEKGADDYVGKPFAFSELLARIHALIRRSGALSGSMERVVGGLEVDLKNKSLRFAGNDLPLTESEFRVAALLARNGGRTVSRSRIGEALWDEPWEGSDNALEAHVKNVRKKLSVAEVPVRIKTVRGIGYRMEETP